MSHDYLGGLSSCGVRAAGRSRSRLAFGHDVEAPAAALLPASRTSRIPEIPPVGRRYADFSDTLLFGGSTLLVAPRAGLILEA